MTSEAAGARSQTFALVETVIPATPGPPLHVRTREDEMWFVLEGNLRVKTGRRVFPATTGAFVFVPKNKAHRFQNMGDAPARILVMTTPAGGPVAQLAAL